MTFLPGFLYEDFRLAERESSFFDFFLRMSFPLISMITAIRFRMAEVKNTHSVISTHPLSIQGMNLS